MQIEIWDTVDSGCLAQVFSQQDHTDQSDLCIMYSAVTKGMDTSYLVVSVNLHVHNIFINVVSVVYSAESTEGISLLITDR